MMGFVYAIEGETGHVKIGWSGNPLRRLAEVRTYSPMGAALLGLVPATRAQETELHQLLAPWCLHGEWYRHEGPVADFVGMLAHPTPRPASIKVPIKALRAELNETQAVFAKRFGVDQATVHRWETKGLPERGAARIAVENLLVRLKSGAAA